MILKLDPRTKLLILILINVIVFSNPDFQTELICIGFIVVLSFLIGAYKQALRGVLMYAGMMAILWICGFFPSVLSGIISMMAICFRKLVPTMIFASALIATTKVSELICALQKIYVPKSIIIPFAVTLRFFPTAKEEFSCIKDAMKLRGIGLNIRNILTRPLTLIECIFVPIMLRCASIAEELSAASVARGIDSEHKRTSLCKLSLHVYDAVGAFIFAVLSVVSALGGIGALYG